MTSKKLLNHLKRLNAKQKGEGHPRYKHIRLSRRVYEMYYGDGFDFSFDN
jgi:hypothetical protein